MQQLSLDAVRMFVTVHDFGGYAKAGEVIGRSQPAISLQIKKLETQLGKKLFTKSGQRHVLSLDGEWFLTQARELLALNDKILQSVQANSLKGRLRLGIPSEFASTLLPSLIGEFSQRYPDVSLDVTSALSRHLLSSAHKDDFDLVLALVPPDQPTSGEVIRKDELVWVGDDSYPIKPDMLSLVLAPDGCVYRSRAIELLKQQTQMWKIRYTNPDLYGLIAAMQQGLGVTPLARSSVPDALQIIRSPLLPKLGKINICLFNFDTQHPEVSKTLSTFIRQRLRAKT
jgi:DNA-binding transcriptional LysR family regulator